MLPSFIMRFRWYSVYVGEKKPLVKQVNQVHGPTRWICNYHFVGVGSEKKSWQMLSVQSHMKVWEHQKKVICCSMEYDTVTFFLHIWHWSVCVVLDVFGLSQVLLFERYWKLTSGRSQPYLKSSNRNWQHFSDGYQDPNHVLSWHGGPLKTEKKTNALMILFSTTTWDRIIFHRIQWILLEDMNETCSVKTPSLFYWNRGGNSYPNRYDFCESTVCHAFPPWNQ